jgi:hypothetical protein
MAAICFLNIIQLTDGRSHNPRQLERGEYAILNFTAVFGDLTAFGS